MEMQANATDRAFAKLGLTMDAVGSSRRVQSLQQASRTARTLGTEAENAAKRMDHLDQSHGRANRSVTSFWRTVRTGLVPALTDMAGILWKVGKPAGLVAGLGAVVGLAAQAIGNLAGGLVIATPRLVQMGAAAASLIPLYVGLGGAMLNVKAVTQDLAKAMGGGPAGAQALRQMGGAGASLVRQLRAARMELREIHRAGTTPILQSLSRGFPTVRQTLFPVARQANAAIGGAVGGLTTQAIQMLARPDTRKNILDIANQGAFGLAQAGQGAIHLAHALTMVAVAAKPLTTFFSETARRIGEWADRTVTAASQTGRLQAFFQRLTVQTQQLFRFLTNVGHVLLAVFRDATPASNAFYGSILRVSEGWRRAADSAEWNARVTRKLLGMLPGLEALGRLVSDLAKAIFDMGSSSGLPKTANALDRAIPALKNFLDLMANQFGPALGQLFVTLTQTLELLGGQSGPLVMVVNGLNQMLKLVNGILRAIGPFRQVVGRAFETVLLLRFLSKMGLVSRAWQIATVSAERYAAASSVAMGGGAVGGAVGGGRGGMFGGLLGGLFGGRAARAGAGEFRMLGGARAMGAGGASFGMETPALGFGLSSSSAAEAGGALGLLGRFGGLGRLAKFGGRLAWPLALLGGGFGALTAARSGSVGHQAAQTLYAGVNAGTAGLLGVGLGAVGLHNVFATPDQRSRSLVNLSQQRLARSGINDQTASSEGMKRLNHDVDVLQYTMARFASDQTRTGEQYRQQLQQEIDMRKALIQTLRDQQVTESGARVTPDVSALNKAYRGAGGGQAGFRAAQSKAQQLLAALPGTANAGERFGLEQSFLAGLPPAQRAAARAAIAAVDPSVRFGPRVRGASGATYGGVFSPSVALDASGAPHAMTGRAQRRDIMGGVSAQDRVAMRGAAFTPVENALLASLRASGFTEANGFNPVVWVNEWEAKVLRGGNPVTTPLVPPGVWARLRRQQARRRARPLDRADATRGLPSGSIRAASGGRLGGFGMGDTVPVLGGMAAPGELVVNRHTETAVNRMLGTSYGTSLGGMVNGEHRRHSGTFATGGRAYPLSRRGKLIGTPGVGTHSFIDPPNNWESDNAVDLATPVGTPVIAVRSGTIGPQIGPLPGATAGGRFAGDRLHLVTNGNEFYYAHLSRLAVNAGQSVAAGGLLGYSGSANGVAHLHFAAMNGSPMGLLGYPLGSTPYRAQRGAAGGRRGQGGGTGAGTADVSLTRAAIIRAQAAGHMLGDVLGSPNNPASFFGLAGVNFVGSQAPLGSQDPLGQMGGPTGGGGGNTGAPGTAAPTGGRYNRAQVMTLMMRNGASHAVAANFAGIAMAESGGRASVLNNNPGTGDYSVGLFQENFFKTLGPARMGRYAPRWGGPTTSVPAYVSWLGQHPDVQAKIAMDLFNSSGYSPWRGDAFVRSHPALLAATGGRTKWGGWHARGMAGTFSSPTLIGVGERGAERVTVTPVGKGGGGSVTMHNQFNIHGGNQEDTKRQIEDALHEVANQLERHFGHDEGSEVI